MVKNLNNMQTRFGLSINREYDVATVLAAPYDFRLSPDKLESRDLFFTKMKTRFVWFGLV
jgi:hypothetical protein